MYENQEFQLSYILLVLWPLENVVKIRFQVVGENIGGVRRYCTIILFLHGIPW